jgi:(4S)-4-hydroxy-5-phosphonooxypentane-2,3-dione isomerase
MYVVTVRLDIDPNHAPDFMRAMGAQAHHSLTLETGCRQFDVSVNPSDLRRVFLYEVYTNRSAFDAHLATPHFRDFDATVRPWVTARAIETWERLGDG